MSNLLQLPQWVKHIKIPTSHYMRWETEYILWKKQSCETLFNNRRCRRFFPKFRLRARINWNISSFEGPLAARKKEMIFQVARVRSRYLYAASEKNHKGAGWLLYICMYIDIYICEEEERGIPAEMRNNAVRFSRKPFLLLFAGRLFSGELSRLPSTWASFLSILYILERERERLLYYRLRFLSFLNRWEKRRAAENGEGKDVCRYNGAIYAILYIIYIYRRT